MGTMNEKVTADAQRRTGGTARRSFSWLTTLLSGQPHFRIGEPGNWYMLRWCLMPRNRWLNLYVHKFLRDDDDRALHDHPWWFVSVMLRGGYIEHMDDGRLLVRRWLSVAFRPAEHRHRVELARDAQGQPLPCWTLIITGPRVRNWGFWCARGFVPWQEFVAATDKGQIGRGCE